MIGVFDSGVGGLSIMKSLVNNLGEYNYYYLGDNNNAPYGNSSFDDIYNKTLKGVEFLFREGCELVIIACNTASARALRKIQQEVLPFKYPGKNVLGIIIPTVEAVVTLSPLSSIALIGTEATIQSKVYDREFKKVGIKNSFLSLATPLLASYIEESKTESVEFKGYLEKSMSFIKDEKIDVLLLACTHYFLIKDKIKDCIPQETIILDIPLVVSEKLALYLKNHPELALKIKKESKLILSSSLTNKKIEKIFYENLAIVNCPKLQFVKF